MTQVMIGVIGGNCASDETCSLAYDIGKHIALNDAIVVCGGRQGVMEAACRGARENGGLTIGILPGEQKSEANPFVSIAIPTGMGIARNTLVVRTGDVVIALPGSYGTLSEIGFALNLNKPVVYLPGAWNIGKIGKVDRELFKEAHDAGSAVGLALNSVI